MRACLGAPPGLDRKKVQGAKEPAPILLYGFRH